MSDKKWLGYLTDFSKQECKSYLRDNSDLPLDNNHVLVLKTMSSKQKIGIEAILEKVVDKWASSSGVYTETAYARGASVAFSNGDYACSLIHRYIGAKEIVEALNL